MNILHLQLEKSWGGGGVQMLSLHNEFTNHFPDVSGSFFCKKNSVLHEKCKLYNYNFFATPMVLKFSVLAIFKLIKVLKTNKFDIIHIHGSTALTLFALTNFFHKTPPGLFHKKTSFKIKDKPFTRYKYNHPNLKKIVCVSSFAKQISLQAITDKNKLKVVYDGIKIPNQIEQHEIQIRNIYNLNSEIKIIGHIGNHIKAKDLDTLINTVDETINKRKEKNICFVQIGKHSKLTENHMLKVQELKLEKHLKFMGQIDNAAALINQFDCFLMTSKSEGIPLVIFESFFNKVPVVSTNAGGIGEIIINKVNGYISNIGDYQNLANQIITLVNSPKLSDEFTERSFQKLIPNFTIQTMAKNMLNVYNEIK